MLLRLLITAAALSLMGCAGSSPAPSASTVTVTQPRAVAAPPAVAPNTTTPATSTGITIPEVAGQNAEIVRKHLEQLGLTDVSLASDNPKYKMVIMAANWTVVSIEPAPGTVVQGSDPVVVKVTKE